MAYIHRQITNDNVSTGDVIIDSPSIDNTVETTSTKLNERVCGICMISASAGNYVQFAREGLVVVNITGNVFIGDYLTSSTTPGKAIASSSLIKGTFAIAKSDSGTPAAGQCYAQLCLSMQAFGSTNGVYYSEEYDTIQDAIDDCQLNGGGTILLEAKTYNECLYISSDNITITGQKGTVLDCMIIDQHVIRVNACDNIQIENIEILGNPASTKHGVHIYGNSKRILLKDIKVSYSYDGFRSTGDGVGGNNRERRFIRCRAENCQRYGWCLDSGAAFASLEWILDDCSGISCGTSCIYMNNYSMCILKRGDFNSTDTGPTGDFSSNGWLVYQVNTTYGNAGALGGPVTNCCKIDGHSHICMGGWFGDAATRSLILNGNANIILSNGALKAIQDNGAGNVVAHNT